MKLKPLKITNIIEQVQQEDANLINWDYISKNYKLPEPFIEKYKNKVNWYYISYYQKLPEPFIEKYKNKVNWYYISRYQNLSAEFVKKHIDKITEDIFDNSCYKSYPDSVKLVTKS